MSSSRILIVDDDSGQRNLLETFLRAQGYATQAASSGEAALQLLAEQEFALLITDVRMPGMSGLETLRRVRQAHGNLPVLLVTAFADIRSAVTAMRDGAVNYLAKPIDLEELIASVRLALNPGAAKARTSSEPVLPEGVVAASPLLQALVREVAGVAPSETRVLITGESGAGKEVFAEILHAWSQRAHAPLVKVSCAVSSEQALESELFGHERGAFPGAAQRRIGRLEEAAGGTVFLDEIADLSLGLQAKLLRAIDDGAFHRLGSPREVRCEARLVAATSRDLEQLIGAGRFREDLFYRLNVVELHLPPLRERPEDVMPLATRFIQQFSRQKPRFSAGVTARLLQYSWPGNVRELRNAMERAALLSRGEIVLPEHLPAKIATAAEPPVGNEAELRRLEEIERDAILRALRKNHFNRTETAKELAISRRTLTYKLQRMRAAGIAVDPTES